MEERGRRSGTGRIMRSFLRSTSANVAIMTAIALPALLGVLGLASDFAQYSSKHAELQGAADKAALAAAKELSLATSSDATIEAAAQSFAAAVTDDEIVTSVKIGSGNSDVTVKIQENWTPFFAHFLGADITPVIVTATAQLVGHASVCVLALDAAQSESISLQNKSVVTANGCGVFSNSKHSEAISLKSKSEIKAEMTCAVGGVSNKGTITPQPMTDCPPIEDPLSSRPAPAVGGCDFNSIVHGSGSVTLAPGVYCGGLVINGAAKVTLKDGIYVIKDGPLVFSGTAAVTGTHVGFYLTGKDAKLDFQGNAAIDLSGPKDGDMAGLLFFADRKGAEDHKISSAKAKNLTGTVYLPTGTLRVDPGAKVAENSAYTAIIARTIDVDMGPELVLNSDYGSTDVPVPDGIRSAAQIVLSD